MASYNGADKRLQYLFEHGGGGGGSTVSITPTLQSGTKIADFEIDGDAGELYAPAGGGSANIWTGTQAEYEAQASQIADGTLVCLTDDEEQARSAIAALTDVALNNLSNGQTLIYNATAGKWENATPAEPVDLGFYIDEQGYICQTITGE